MEWIVKIEKTPDLEDETPQRIRFVFDPMAEKIHVYGEAKVKQNKWFIFSERIHKMEINLEGLQEQMEMVVVEMRKRLVEYDNLDKGFSVLKWVGFEDDESIEGQDSQLLV